MRFSGAQLLQLPDVMGAASATEGEMYIVMKSAGTGSGYAASNFGSYAAYNTYGQSNGIIENFGTNSYYSFGLPPQALTDWHLYNVSAKAGAWVARQNGRPFYTKTSNTVAFRTNPVLGAGYVYSSQGFNGDIAEVLVYDHVLTDAEREAVGRYLTTKYATLVAPETPLYLDAVALSNTQVSLAWDVAPGKGIQYYEVERQTGTGAYELIATVEDSLGYQDNTVVAGTSYTYRVRARNYIGRSGYSDEAGVTTPTDVAVAMPATGLKLWLKADTGTGTGQVECSATYPVDASEQCGVWSCELPPIS